MIQRRSTSFRGRPARSVAAAVAAALGALGVLGALALAAPPAIAQVGHPAKGSWLGYWGPSEGEERRLRLLLNWEDQALTGVINPGPNAAPVTRAELDYDTWTLTLEAALPTADGDAAAWVATGTLENLGSWRNRRYAGTYVHGDEEGEFTLTLH